MLMFINPASHQQERKKNYLSQKNNQSINHNPSNPKPTPIYEPLPTNTTLLIPQTKPTPFHPPHLPPCPKSSSKNPPTTSEPHAPRAASPTTGSEKRGARTSWAPSPAGSSSTPPRNGPRGDRRRRDGTWRISATSFKQYVDACVRGMDRWMDGWRDGGMRASVNEGTGSKE